MPNVDRSIRSHDPSVEGSSPSRPIVCQSDHLDFPWARPHPRGSVEAGSSKDRSMNVSCSLSGDVASRSGLGQATAVSTRPRRVLVVMPSVVAFLRTIITGHCFPDLPGRGRVGSPSQRSDLGWLDSTLVGRAGRDRQADRLVVPRLGPRRRLTRLALTARPHLWPSRSPSRPSKQSIARFVLPNLRRQESKSS